MVFKVIPVPVIAKLPEVMPTALTAPPLVTVKALVPVANAAEAVMLPELL